MTTPNDPVRLQLLIQGLAAGLGGEASLDEVDHSEPSHPPIPLLRCTDSPGFGITTWATTTLSLVDWTEDGLEVRLELITASGTDQAPMAGVLAAILVQATVHRWLPAPGRVLLDVMGLGGLSSEAERLPHVMIDYPFPWGERLKPIDVLDSKVFPLMAFPISEAEMKVRRDQGRDALLELLEEKEVEIFDLDRACSVTG